MKNSEDCTGEEDVVYYHQYTKPNHINHLDNLQNSHLAVIDNKKRCILRVQRSFKYEDLLYPEILTFKLKEQLEGLQIQCTEDIKQSIIENIVTSVDKINICLKESYNALTFPAVVDYFLDIFSLGLINSLHTSFSKQKLDEIDQITKDFNSKVIPGDVNVQMIHPRTGGYLSVDFTFSYGNGNQLT
ncbi:hypothetical protein WICPIJ_007492 [Wickerhamomyces pijperi]|uniref:Golgin subfamily A member 7/ERF4 domain-containing protein n=1 Tax=Wickerhamomyces pijperi TaxID=599730 RepID=A0A9P8Q0F0_WICPI|nr:hypothetical protein WICPIJ_007492 [Wickerhamomyces pijperi]